MSEKVLSKVLKKAHRTFLQFRPILGLLWAILELQDYTGKPIAGYFYSEEIFKTTFPNEYLIEQILLKKPNQLYVK